MASMLRYSMLVTRGPESGRRLELKPGLTLLGRLPKAHKNDPKGSRRWTFSDPRVSRTHSAIAWRKGEAPWLTHLSRTSETLLEGMAVGKSPLQPRQRIRLGETTLVLEVSGPVPSPFPQDFEEDEFLPKKTGPRCRMELARSEHQALISRMFSHALREGDVRATQDPLPLLKIPAWGELWLLGVGERLVGYLALTYRHSLQSVGRIAHLETLYLHPKYRQAEVQVGTLELILGELQASGCQRVEWSGPSWMEDGVCETLGFERPQGRIWSMQLPCDNFPVC